MTDTRAIDAPRMTDAQIAEILRLLRKVDSVELKVTVPVEAHRATIAGLSIDPVESEPRQVFFLDTPDLALDRAGIVVRARRFQGGRADTVIKLRPVVPDELPPDLKRSGAFSIEVDVLPGGFMCSGSLKGRATGQEVRDAMAGTMPIRKVFSKEQRALFASRAPADLALDGLSVLGPVFVLKSVFMADTAQTGTSVRRIVAEMWLYPDGSRILELSTKCLPKEAIQAAGETRAWLLSRGVDLGGEQQAKTRTALSYFAASLDSTGTASGTA